jgi:FkbM family methyltransferase
MLSDRERVQDLLCRSFGIDVPYVQMGHVDSLSLLLNFNELVIFDFYERRQDRYERVVDVGANIGIHTLMMSKYWDVTAYEPDPFHYGILLGVVEGWPIQTLMQAVSDHGNPVDFVRVLGNTTSSHIRGAKVPYGEIETFKVGCVDVRSFDYDLMKLDAEGHEATILLRLSEEQLSKMDVIAEVGNPKNAAIIFDHFQKLGFPIRSQLKGWDVVTRLEDMPTSHREGSIFIGREF